VTKYRRVLFNWNWWRNKAKAYADANGLTYSVSAVCWMQGEAEGITG
jgi:hypothetical protein